jgi:hypothetical protein
MSLDSPYPNLMNFATCVALGCANNNQTGNKVEETHEQIGTEVQRPLLNLGGMAQEWLWVRVQMPSSQRQGAIPFNIKG